MSARAYCRRSRFFFAQLHNSLGDGKPPQAGMDDVLAAAPPLDADAATPDPLLEPVPPLDPDPPGDP